MGVYWASKGHKCLTRHILALPLTSVVCHCLLVPPNCRTSQHFIDVSACYLGCFSALVGHQVVGHLGPLLALVGCQAPDCLGFSQHSLGAKCLPIYSVSWHLLGAKCLLLVTFLGTRWATSACLLGRLPALAGRQVPAHENQLFY